MLDKIESKINTLKSGSKLIVGSGIEINEMQKIVNLCESLESSGQIRIINKHQESKTGQHLVDAIILQKL